MNNPKRILVVDDDPDILEAIFLTLNLEGYHVIKADKADGVTELAISEMPDLILLDVLLSGFDGREIAKRLKNDPRTASIPVIMISAHPGVSKTTENSGADAFLEKPFNLTDLISLVSRFTS
jgi:DNA-binding response OmpR family regulator